MGDHRRQRGQLKIFFSYAAGAGKTWAMLKEAREAWNQGIDVAAGFVEPYGRAKTAALLDGLEELPPLEGELNLDGALERHPQVILVDDLAHTNGRGCRHNKRYQDVEELLNAGIDVYATVGVQHIESLNDVVASITGFPVDETIPDSVFDGADQVELVDVEPKVLIERMNAGEIYEGEQANRAIMEYFTVANLMALRELAMRRCADRVRVRAQGILAERQREYHTEEHILVCLSSSPSNAKIIRTAARMYQAFRGSFTALFVETSGFSGMSRADRGRLEFNTHLARQLGARIETVYGDDIPYQIAEFARLSGVTKIVIGRSSAARRHILGKPVLTEKLIEYAPELDIHIIPDQSVQAGYRDKKAGRKVFSLEFQLADMVKCVAALAGASVVGLLFQALGFSEANIITIYILSVLMIAVVTANQVYSVMGALLSVFIFNFLFTEPKYTLLAYDPNYVVTFAVMLIAALITGSLAGKLKHHARQSAQTAYRTHILFDTNQMLGKAESREAILSIAAGQLVKLLGRDVVMYVLDQDVLEGPQVFAVEEHGEDGRYGTAQEYAVADWVRRNNKHAGATTSTFSKAQCLYMALRVNDTVYGVVGIEAQGASLDIFENGILLSILGECALALENDRNAREKEQAAILAKNEQLRANLLRTISHDLRTPLTSISGNASNLLGNAEGLDEAAKSRIYQDIYDDSMWLINLVENLLSVSRLEEEKVKLNMSAELIDEVIGEALSHVNRKAAEHEIHVETEELCLAKMDAKLMVQVLINMIDNAVKYTPQGSGIWIRAWKEEPFIKVSVADDGPGIPKEDQAHVFDMFYSGANRVADSRRSLGLGLALCKSIITLHGGEITVADRVPHGTEFTFTLPAEEVRLYE